MNTEKNFKKLVMLFRDEVHSKKIKLSELVEGKEIEINAGGLIKLIINTKAWYGIEQEEYMELIEQRIHNLQSFII